MENSAHEKEKATSLVAARKLLEQRDREKKSLEVQFEQEATSLYADRQKAESALLENRRKFGDDAARRMLIKPEVYFDSPEDEDQKFVNPGRMKDQIDDQDRQRAAALKRELENIGDEQRALRDIILTVEEDLEDDYLEKMPRPTGEDLNAALRRIEEQVTDATPAARAQRILDVAAKRQSAEEIQSDQEALKDVTARNGSTLKEQTEKARSGFQESKRELVRQFASIYEHPSKAVDKFQSRLEQDGFQNAISTLTESPKQYGTLSRDVDRDGLSWPSKSYIEGQEKTPTAAEAYINAPGGRDTGEIQTAAEFALRWSKRVELDTKNLMERQEKTRSEVYREGTARTRRAIDRAAEVLGSAKQEYNRLQQQLEDNPQDNYESELNEQLDEADEGVWQRLRNKVQQIGGWTNQKTAGSQTGRSHEGRSHAGSSQAGSRKSSNASRQAGGTTQRQGQGQTTQNQGGSQARGNGQSQKSSSQPSSGQSQTGPNTQGTPGNQGGTRGQTGGAGPSPAGVQWTFSQQQGGSGANQGPTPQMKAKRRSLAMGVKKREQALQSFLNRIYQNPADAQIRIEQNAFKNGLSTNTKAFARTQKTIRDDLRWFGKTDDRAIQQLKYDDDAKTRNKGRRTWRWARLGAEVAEGVVERGPDEPTEEALKKVRTAAKGAGFLAAGAAAYGAITAKDTMKKAWRRRQARKKAKKELNRRLNRYGNALQKYQGHLSKANAQGQNGQAWRQQTPTGPFTSPNNAPNHQKNRQAKGGNQPGAGGGQGGGQGPGGSGGGGQGPRHSGGGQGQGSQPQGSGQPTGSSQSQGGGQPQTGSNNQRMKKSRGGQQVGTGPGSSSQGGSAGASTTSPKGPSVGSSGQGSGSKGTGARTSSSGNAATRSGSPVSGVKQQATREAIRGKKAVESDHVTLGGQPVWFSERNARSSGQTQSRTSPMSPSSEGQSSSSTRRSATGGRSQSRGRGR